VDVDDLVVEAEGRSIARIFDEAGETYFREAEWKMLQTLDGCEGCVVAAGGGLFLGPAPRRFMKRRGPTVWLDVSLATCRARLGTGGERPLWRSSEPTAMRALFERRRAAYALADTHVRPAPEDPPSHVAGAVLEALGRGRGRVFR
jgi:shikimate kinase